MGNNATNSNTIDFRKTKKYKQIRRKIENQRGLRSQFKKLEAGIIRGRDIDEDRVFTLKDYQYIEMIKTK